MRTETRETTVAQEIIDLEKRYWEAMRNGDVETAVELTGFPCVVSGPQGVNAVDQKTYEKMMGAMPYAIESLTFGKMRVQTFGENVAVVGYELSQKLHVDDEPITMQCAEVSTWARIDGAWKCVQHAEAVRGDPFGCDRVEQPELH